MIDLITEAYGPEVAAAMRGGALTKIAKDHATRFGLARLCASDGATALNQIRLAYREWATAEDAGPLPDAEIAPALAQMFAKAGIEMGTGKDGKPVVIGVALKA